MGWGHCGQDSQGRNIGYMIPATCDREGCEEEIDRGLSYACGGMHGDDEYSCELYFCEKHRTGCIFTNQGRYISVCKTCEKLHSKALADE